MTTASYQPILPVEGAYTDPELNFIDESPRGFFPENQDSNWGWKRKVFTDQVQELFDQLNLIYGEIFPQTSTYYLDEWEEAMGLPQNPPNKTLEQRRQAVLNRLRGGPFTRTQRREIVESYIRATFGDPIKLLPAGVEMIVAGQPLYNEPGDLASLYSILETIPSFQYEVRIQSGLAIDQVGLERDLRWFTPAGISIIFNYSWLSKTGSDSGHGVDTVSAGTGSAFSITVFDTGVGTDGVKYTVVDTGTGTDTGSTAHGGTDSGSGTDIALSPSMSQTGAEGGVGTESVSDRKIVVGDTGTSSEGVVMDYPGIHPSP